MPIRYIDRETGLVVDEKRHDVGVLEFLYGQSMISRLVRKIIRRHFVSMIYGWIYHRKVSPNKLQKFVDKLNIDMKDAEKPISQYASRNDVFIRTLHPCARSIDSDLNTLLSPADSSLFVIPELNQSTISVKNGDYTLEELLQDQALAGEFKNGAVLIFRLIPKDYHRFHFPDGGFAKAPKVISGSLDSVSAYATARDPKIFCHNQREVVILDSDHFGKMLLIPIGAVMIGKIVQTYKAGRVERGEEQGYFEIGGSSILMVMQKETIKFDEDLISNSFNGLETKIKMGTRIGVVRLAIPIVKEQ